MSNRNSTKGNPPYQPTPAPDPAPASMFTPAPPPQVFPSEHAARSFESRQTQHYRTVVADAARQAGTAVALGGQVDKLSEANRQDGDSIERAEQAIREMRAAIDQRNQEIGTLSEEKALNETCSRNNSDDAEATVRLLEMHGFARPSVTEDRLVAPITASVPTGSIEALPCGCGDLMRLDGDHNRYIHMLPEGGWEMAGESCKRRRDQTLTMPPVGDDVVAGS